MKNTIYAFWQLLLLGLAFTAQSQKLRTTKWESGELDHRTKVGVWEYYGYTPSKEKVVVQRYDHTAKQLVYFRPMGEMTYNTEVSPGEWKRRPVDQPPLFIGGDAALAAFTTQLQYPQQAQDRNVQGAVTVAFAIDNQGRTSGHHILRGIGAGCDQEALRIAKTIPDEWVPAQVASKPVPTEYELTLTFRLAQP